MIFVLLVDLMLSDAVAISFEATFVLLLIFPFRREAGAGLGFDVVPPHVFRTFAVGPHVLAGDTAGVTPDALVQMKHHGDLRANLHWVVDC